MGNGIENFLPFFFAVNQTGSKELFQGIGSKVGIFNIENKADICQSFAFASMRNMMQNQDV